jgi:hypothetical protein
VEFANGVDSCNALVVGRAGDIVLDITYIEIDIGKMRRKNFAKNAEQIDTRKASGEQMGFRPACGGHEQHRFITVAIIFLDLLGERKHGHQMAESWRPERALEGKNHVGHCFFL